MIEQTSSIWTIIILIYLAIGLGIAIWLNQGPEDKWRVLRSWLVTFSWPVIILPALIHRFIPRPPDEHGSQGKHA